MYLIRLRFIITISWPDGTVKSSSRHMRAYFGPDVAYSLSVHTRMNQIKGEHLLPLMCPLAEMSTGWGVESMPFPLCQPVRNPAQGNLRMSLCFGRLSSSSSPVILWSCQASCSLPHSLSTLMGMMGEKTRSGLCQERPKYPVHLLHFPPQGHSYPQPPPRDPQSGDRR